jgi:multiple sugar transport system substrate-binding protein
VDAPDLQPFEERHPDIDVQISLEPWANRDERLATAIAGGAAPDITQLIPDQIPQYVETGGLQPVTDVLDEFGDLHDEALAAVTYEGEAYIAPLYQTATTTVYNTAVLEAAGIDSPPTTWDEMREAAAAWDGEGSLYAYGAAPEETLNLTFYPLLWQAGGSVFTEDGSAVAFNSPEGLAALELLVDLQEQGALSQSYLTSVRTYTEGALVEGRVGMTTGANALEAAQLLEAWGEEHTVIGEPLIGEEQVGFGLPGGVAITAGAQNPEAAKVFISYLMSDEVMADLNLRAGFFPPRSDVTLDTDDEMVEHFQGLLPLLRAGEVHPAARQINSLLSTEIQTVLTSGKDPQQALDDAEAEANRLIEAGG